MVSLSLCFGFALLWWRSYRIIDYIQWTDHRHFPGFVSSEGRMIYSYQFWPNGVGGNEPGVTFGSRAAHTPYWGRGVEEASRNHYAGFEWSPAARVQPKAGNFIIIMPPTPATTVVAAPHWFLCLLAGMPGLVWLWRRGRRKRPSGYCPDCGYDLRATPERCPECGRETGRGRLG